MMVRSVPNSFILPKRASGWLYSNFRKGQWPMYALLSINMIPGFSQNIIVIVEKDLSTLCVGQPGRKHTAYSLVITVVTSKKQPVLSDVLHRKIDHASSVVTPGNVNVHVRRVLQRFAGVFPVDSTAYVSKHKHGFGVSGGNFDEFLWQRDILRFPRVKLNPRMTDRRMHMDQHFEVGELFNDGVIKRIIDFDLIVKFSSADHSGIHAPIDFVQGFFLVFGIEHHRSEQSVRMVFHALDDQVIIFTKFLRGPLAMGIEVSGNHETINV